MASGPMSLIQRSFAAGEVGPAIYGRADQVKYQTGLAVARNLTIKRHGGVANRAGTLYIAAQHDHTKQGRILPFVFNAEQTYVLFFEEGTLRLVRNDQVITASGVAAYNGGTAYVIGDLAASGGVNYYCIADTTGNAPPNATYWYAMPAGDIYEIPTPYQAEDLHALYISQSADVVTITEVHYPIADLAREGHTQWTLTEVVNEPGIAAPATLGVSGATGVVCYWVATAVMPETFEESLPSPEVGANSIPTSGAKRTLTIATVPGALEYNVYRHDGSGIFGYVGVSKSGTFVDSGFDPDYTNTPPASRDPFGAAGDYPAISGYLQQRKCYGGMTNDPETVRTSRPGLFNNFTKAFPLQDDMAADWTPNSEEVNEIRHVLEVGESFILTSGAEWVAFGDGSGALTPATPGLKRQSKHGSSRLPPIVVGSSFLFVQARGSIVRDVKFEAQSNGYAGRDLTVFSPHLFEGFTITHWAYAQIPHSIIYAVRSDGALLAFTYLRDHEVWGWTILDTDGHFEDVCVIPVGMEDVVYVLVRRTINGSTVRYLERFASRTVSDIAVDATFMDSHLSYDGRHTAGTITMTLTGSGWTHDDTLTLTASAGYFVAGDEGKAIRLSLDTETYDPETGWDTETTSVEVELVTYSSATVFSVRPVRTIPAAFQAVAISVWAKGVKQVAGLDHLEGKTLAILGDGNVITNGIDEPNITVSGGSFSTELERWYYVIHAGLPYCSDFQTLDLEILGGETLSDKKKHVPFVTLLVEASRGLWAGEPNEDRSVNPDDLVEWQQRAVEDEYATMAGITGKVEISIKSSWNLGGRVHVRQRDPLPLSILAIIPSVTVGG